MTTVKTFDQVLELMVKTDPTAKHTDVFRLCAMVESEMVGDLNRREMINLFQEGFQGYKTPADVERLLSTLGESVTDDDGNCFPGSDEVQEIINTYYGK